MRLKKIEVLGFKSFADRQVIMVDDHITGVIGPNGCGKSNIVDAVRWAMGEQSAKHLRGGGMADVIFAGCTTRGPAGMAEVTLTFENQGDAPAHLDQPEIALSRRLYSDGTSEYLINKVPARLRDITQLLMGTGVGTKGYSIIEQGQVGRIVGSKAEERRHVIDEAAGITRFKAQRAAAVRKIDATRQNLLRTSDVIAELEGRISTLRRQAQKAERYKRYRAELGDLELWVAAHKHLELTSTGSVLHGRRDGLSTQIEDLRAALDAREAQMDAKRTDGAAVEQELTAAQQQVYDLDNRVRLVAAEQDYRRREREGLVQSGAQARGEGEVVARALATVEQELTEVRAQIELLGESDDEQATGGVEQLDAAHRAAEALLNQTRLELDAARAELGERGSALAGAEARCESHRESATAAQQRLQTAESQRIETAADLEHTGSQSAALALEVEAGQAGLETLQTHRAELDGRRMSLRSQVAAAEVELDTKRAEVHRHRSRLQSLEEIQSRYRGCHSGVQLVMEHRDELASAQLSTDGSSAGSGEAPAAVFGILADYVNVPAHLETAVSAMLGDRLEGIVVDGPEVGARGVAILKREQEGRTTFVPRGVVGGKLPDDSTLQHAPTGVPLGWQAPSGAADETGTNEGAAFEVVDLSAGEVDSTATATQSSATQDWLQSHGVLGALADLVELSGGIGDVGRAMMGDAVVVESLDRALELWHGGKVDRTLVTLEGDRLDATGVVTGGSPTALNAALLQQKREIRELQEILEELDRDFASARGRHLGLAQELAEVEAAREQSERDVLEAEKTRVAASGELARLRGELSRLEAEHARQNDLCAQLQREGDRRDVEIQQLLENIEQSQARIGELEITVVETEAGIAALVGERDRCAQVLTDAKIELARWQQQTDALAQTKVRLDRQVESEAQRLERLEASAASAQVRVEELDKTSAVATSEREDLVKTSKEVGELVHTARGRFEALRVQTDELGASMRTLRDDLEQRREVISEVELGLQEISLERQHLLTDVRDRFDIELGKVLVDYHVRALAGPQERDRLKELKRVLSRMGEVNLTAIDEFEEVSTRYEYLTGQRDDLEQAIAQLQEAIDTINKTSEELFRTTFDAVNKNFQVLFPRLFGGGQAMLKLTDPTDLLATGVEIEARPPGKQPRTLDLLSGGEKALTAVSLIFAIFLIKPSPFCLLDEVDAPLDDANVARFTNMVRELAATTQFIIITHNKVTMEATDRLYGVTMAQRGVSKLVSVNLRRAVEIAYN